MNTLKNMNSLTKYDEMNFEELFKLYLERLPDSEVLYYPDFFIKDIHTEYLRENKISLPNPIYATWDIVNECNLCCAFCSANAPYENNEKIDNKDALKIAKKIVENGIKYISIRGGEPTLCKQITKVINYFNDNNIFVEIVTNGRYLDDEFFKHIKNIEKSIFRIKISIDSCNKEHNDKQRGKNSFLYATNAMEKCNEYGFDFRNQIVITKNNYLDLYDTFIFCQNKHAKSFGSIVILPIGRGKNSQLKISLNKDILLQLHKCLDKEKNCIIEKVGLGVDAIKNYMLYANSKNEDNDISNEESIILGHLKCNGYKTRIYISPKGDIYPCDLLQYSEYYGGNILKNDDYWNSNAAKYLRKITRKDRKKCYKCKIKNCNMGCPAITLTNSHKIEDAIPNCEF